MARQALSYMQSEACHAYEVSNDELFNQESYLGDTVEKRGSDFGSESKNVSESE